MDGIERELKFSLVEAPPDPPSVVALGRGGRYAFVEAEVATHVDTYFDDERGNLRRAGWALRQRRAAAEETGAAADRSVVATLKSQGSVDGAWHRRQEIEAPLREGTWPVPVARALAAHVEIWRLRPLLELEVVRHTYRVTRDGRLLATLAFDQVTARRPGVERSAHFDEVELEAAAGVDLDALQGAVALLEEVVRLTPSPVTKLQRALAALELGAAL